MKKVKRFNYRVVAVPVIYPTDSECEIKVRCESIKNEIKRHIDNIASVYISWDTQVYCEYCGYEWEQDENGCPLCCDKAVEEWEKQRKEAQLRDLGYANGWQDTPDIVKACRARGHIPEEINRGRCLNEYRCVECGYKYLVDSSG